MKSVVPIIVLVIACSAAGAFAPAEATRSEPNAAEHESLTTKYEMDTAEHEPLTPKYEPSTAEHSSIRPEYEPKTPEHETIKPGHKPITAEYKPITPEYEPRTPEHESITAELELVDQFSGEDNSNFFPAAVVGGSLVEAILGSDGVKVLLAGLARHVVSTMHFDFRMCACAALPDGVGGGSVQKPTSVSWKVIWEYLVRLAKNCFATSS